MVEALGLRVQGLGMPGIAWVVSVVSSFLGSRV